MVSFCIILAGHSYPEYLFFLGVSGGCLQVRSAFDRWIQ